MSMPKDEIQAEVTEAWRVFLNALENSMQKLDADIREAGEPDMNAVRLSNFVSGLRRASALFFQSFDLI